MSQTPAGRNSSGLSNDPLAELELLRQQADDASGADPIALERLAAIVQSSDDAIVSKTLQGIIRTWNAGAERIFGWKAEEVIGKPINIIIPPDRQGEEPQILSRIQRGERVDHYETIRMTKDGRLINVSVTISPVRNSEGKIVAASKIARDITEQKRIANEREELLARERDARLQAEQAGRLKDEFLANLSHELRTPLNAILGWSQLLRARPIPDEEVAEGLAVIERNTRVQVRLIEDLLDMSRIVSGKLSLEVQPVDLHDVIRVAIAAVRQSAEAKGIGLQMMLDPFAGPVRGDANRLQQCVLNLLSNAIKFTHGGGRVRVSLERVNGHAQVSVSDSGEGIRPEFLPHVFERFRQADATTTRRQGGLGLGLSIVKHLVELHGGTVSAESEGIGRGATFRIDLPLMSTHAPSHAPHTPPAVVPSSPVPAQPSLAGTTVLAVDDEADARVLLRRVLEGCGAKVLIASSANEGLEMLRRERPNVLVSDIGMPDIDGYEFIRRVRQLKPEEGAFTPAAALTAFARSEDRTRALLAGYQTHVAKPVEPTELTAVVASLALTRQPQGR